MNSGETDLVRIEKKLISILKTIFSEVTTEQEVLFSKDLKQPLARLSVWCKALNNNQLDYEEFSSLVRGAFAVAEMKSLTRAGLSKTHLDLLQERIFSTLLKLSD